VVRPKPAAKAARQSLPLPTSAQNRLSAPASSVLVRQQPDRAVPQLVGGAVSAAGLEQLERDEIAPEPTALADERRVSSARRSPTAIIASCAP